MLVGSTRVSGAVFAVFLTLQITLVVLVVGFFLEAHGQANNGWIHAGGWLGILTAACAWYASAAGVVNGMSAPKITLPVGLALWRPRMAPRMAKG
jgi:succinate-acetate transporter protein